MADYWKSNDRKFCDFCKCWLADNKPSIAFHENGKRHKENVSKRISQISHDSAKSERDQQKMDYELRKMEEAARVAYAEDISRNADISSQCANRALAAAQEANSKSTCPSAIGPTPTESSGRDGKRRQVDPLALPMSAAELEARRIAATRSSDSTGETSSSLWCESVSEEGHVYYWNVKTNETVWEKPKCGYLTLAEYDGVMEQAKRAQECKEEAERKFMCDNADELAAKYNREKLKQRRAEYEATKRKEQTVQEPKVEIRSEAAEPKQEDYPAREPFGKWQIVEKKETAAPLDWQLPSTTNYDQVPRPAVMPEQPTQPVQKVFKEKIITHLNSAEDESEAVGFKKRKINRARSSRQANDYQ